MIIRILPGSFWSEYHLNMNGTNEKMEFLTLDVVIFSPLFTQWSPVRIGVSYPVIINLPFSSIMQGLVGNINKSE